MYRQIRPLGLAIALLVLTACGASSDTAPVAQTTTRGLLLVAPARLASLDAAGFTAQLGASSSGAALLKLTGTPACGVDFYYMQYETRGGAGEPTTATGALMLPTGAAPACSGARPIVLYAHGTTTNKNYNLADIANPANQEGALIAAMFAAQGYIVVAPNYAGYDASTLTYHPYLNADQQSGEMLDALAAARSALPTSLTRNTTDSGALFVTGYSQGGYVALAAARALQASGKPPVAIAGGSGPYALEAFGDAIFLGNVNLGSTIFAPLVATSYQHAYGNIFQNPSDIFGPPFSSGIYTLLPSTTPMDQLFATGKLPLTALFDSTTPVTGNPLLDKALQVPPVTSPLTQLFAAGFGEPNLINNSYRVSYAIDAVSDPDGALPLDPATLMPKAPARLAAAPQQPLRHALWQNDLRNGGWIPAAPLLMCGGENDPTVFFPVNTVLMATYWGAMGVPAQLITVLDVDPLGGPSGAFAALQTAFLGTHAQQIAYLTSPAGGGLTLAQAQQQWIQNYHGTVAPFCLAAARGFFLKVAGAG